jgi:hypothetical protein
MRGWREALKAGTAQQTVPDLSAVDTAEKKMVDGLGHM